MDVVPEGESACVECGGGLTGPPVFCVNYRGILGSCQLLVVNCQGFLACRLLTASPFPSHVVLSTHSAFFPLFHWDTGERKPTTREYTSQRVRPVSSAGAGGAGGIGSRSQCACAFFMPSSKCSDQCSDQCSELRINCRSYVRSVWLNFATDHLRGATKMILLRHHHRFSFE